MKRVLAPSLARRMLGAVLVAIALVWLVVMVINFWVIGAARSSDNQTWLEQEGRLLETLASPGEAARFLRQRVEFHYHSFNKKPLIGLLTANRQPVFFTSQSFACPHAATGSIHLDGQLYRTYRLDGQRWSLCAAFAAMTVEEFWREETGKINQQLFGAVLLTMPVVLLALISGLLPLQRLSQRLASREAGDLAPLGFDARYQELTPLVSAIDSMLLRLRNRIAREQAFVENAAHELRTPLAVIAAQKDVLIAAVDGAASDEAKQRIAAALERALHLTGQLAEQVRVDRTLPRDNPTVNPGQATLAVVAQMRTAAAARDITLSCHVAPDLLCRLEQQSYLSILTNLIDNAIRYGHRGGQVAIALGPLADSVPPALRLTVADDGPGIGEDERERVFERFYRGQASSVSGSGLGLSIVKQAAKRLNAHITQGTGIGGRGCQFTVLMPLLAAGAPPVATAGTMGAASIRQRLHAGLGSWLARLAMARHALGRFWRRLLVPSLVRRAFFALMLAYPVMWLAMLLNHYSLEQALLERKTPQFMAQDSAVLDYYREPQQVVGFMQSAMRRYRCLADVPVDNPPHFVEVWDRRQARRVFADPLKHYPPDLLGERAVPDKPVVVDGVAYQVERRDGRYWSLRVARPVLTPLLVIRRDAFNPELWLVMLVSIPLVMLPIGLAVWQGFRPLRVLARYLYRREVLHVAASKPDLDYVELKSVSEALDSLLARLRARTEREKRFVAEVAQALQTPMSVIAEQVACLAAQDSVQQKRVPYQNIVRELAHAGRLIHQLLELARIDGIQARAVQQLDLVALVQVDLAQWADLAWQHDIELTLEMPDSLSFALEKNPFQLILHNLVDNAIRYGRTGGQVEVVLSRDQAALLLEVADDGPGIAAEHAERVFERFWRADPDAASGAGLGLSIVRQAAARLGATVTFGVGINGRGCRFGVRFPANPAPDLAGQLDGK